MPPKKQDTTPDTTNPVPTSYVVEGQEHIRSYKESLEERRKNLYQAMKNVKAIQLNTGKRIVFDLTESVNGGSVLLSLSAQDNRIGVFGENLPLMENLPFHALAAIYESLQNGDLFDISDGKPRDTEVKPSRENTAPKDPMENLDPDIRQEVTRTLNKAPSGEYTGNSSGEIQKWVESLPKNHDGDFKLNIAWNIESENMNRQEVLSIIDKEVTRRRNEQKEKELLSSIGK